MKRILAIEDLSCIGKCSLTAALPILSAMGIECCVLPTAVLSSHTAFKNVYAKNLSEDIPGILDAWEKEGIRFDGFLSGYLASKQETEVVWQIWDRFGTREAVRIVDPAMADKGELYPGLSKDLIPAMKELCIHADAALPNYSELCMMNDAGFCEYPSEDEQKSQLLCFAEECQGSAVLTGFEKRDGLIGAAAYDRENESIAEFSGKKLPGAYTGTGDIFASVFAGAWILGEDMQNALESACLFTSLCIQKTLRDKSARWYGVNFEQALPWLCEKYQKYQ